MTPDASLPKPRATCSICGKPVEPAYKPFCSKRCANIDLHRWLNNCYAVPGAPQDQDEQSADNGSDTE